MSHESYLSEFRVTNFLNQPQKAGCKQNSTNGINLQAQGKFFQAFPAVLFENNIEDDQQIACPQELAHQACTTSLFHSS
jgi:hypothetical protein